MPPIDYKRWIADLETTGEELAAMERQVAGFGYLPRISVVLVASDADEVLIKNSVDSVLGQIYPSLELCVCDNGSKRPHVPEVLEDYAVSEERVSFKRLSEKKSWAEACNATICMATGEFVALLDEGDELAPEALFEVVEFLQSVEADMIYTDEDRIDISGRRSDPVFKPYWSPDLLLSTAYIGRLCVMRANVLEAAGAFREGFGGAEEHDMALRFSERTGRIFHLPEVLYHRRKLPETNGSSVEDRASSQAVEEALARREEDAYVEPVDSSLRVVRRISGHPRVSVIVFVPQGATEVPLIEVLESETAHPIHQVIAASDEREISLPVDRASHLFPARALNMAARMAEGEYLVFIDGRVQIETPGWLSELLGQAQRRNTGAVGCKLLNMDGGLRHGGSLMEVSRMVNYPDELTLEDGKPPPLVDEVFNFAGASAECMMVRKAVLEEVGGFDDEKLPTALYDLDLSLRLREHGLLNVYTPHASLVCGSGRLGALPGEGEIAYMWKRWWKELVQLLYYRWSPLYAARYGIDGEAAALLYSGAEK